MPQTLSVQPPATVTYVNGTLTDNRRIEPNCGWRPARLNA